MTIHELDNYKQFLKSQLHSGRYKGKLHTGTNGVLLMGWNAGIKQAIEDITDIMNGNSVAEIKKYRGLL